MLMLMLVLVLDPSPREAKPFTRITRRCRAVRSLPLAPSSVPLIPSLQVRGLYRKERTDHGRQPAPVALSIVPKSTDSLRVAENPPASSGTPPPKFLDRVRWHLRVKRYSIRTEQVYIDWIRRFTP